MMPALKMNTQLRTELINLGLDPSTIEVIHAPLNTQYPQIYKIHSTTGVPYILKIVEDNHDLPGEEHVVDLLLDSFLSEVMKKHSIYDTARTIQKLVHLEDAKQTTIVLSNYIHGTPMDKLKLSFLEIDLNLFFGYLWQPISVQLLSSHKSHTPALTKRIDLRKKLLGLQNVNFATYFFNDINRTELVGEDQKSKLTAEMKALASTFEHLLSGTQLIHGDIKHKNTIVTHQSNLTTRLVPIDWSAAHFGPVWIDLIDCVLSEMAVVSANNGLSLYEKLVNLFSKNGFTFDMGAVNCIKFFAFFKLFSIARVWYPEKMPEVLDTLIDSKNCSVEDILHRINYIKNLRY